MRGLHLWVRPDLKKYWIFRFTFAGRRYDMSLGSFPAVSLSDAKKRALILRGKLFNGENPSVLKKLESAENQHRVSHIKFMKFADEYINRMSPMWTSGRHEHDWNMSICSYVNPVIGSLDFESINTNHILEILSPIWTSSYLKRLYGAGF
jgi:hypothetical protein